MTPDDYSVHPIGRVVSALSDPTVAPKQGHEGGTEAWVELEAGFLSAARHLAVGEEILLLTWLHRGDRTSLEVHPRDDPNVPMKGVFSTRSADRPNPIGLHPVRITAIDGNRLLVTPLEAVDGTPVVDIKPVV